MRFAVSCSLRALRLTSHVVLPLFVLFFAGCTRARCRCSASARVSSPSSPPRFVRSPVRVCPASTPCCVARSRCLDACPVCGDRGCALGVAVSVLHPLLPFSSLQLRLIRALSLLAHLCAALSRSQSLALSSSELIRCFLCSSVCLLQTVPGAAVVGGAGAARVRPPHGRRGGAQETHGADSDSACLVLGCHFVSPGPPPA